MDKVKEYTEVWNDFQIREPVYLLGNSKPYEYDVVKWQEHNPIEVVDLRTGEKRISTRSCFTIATLTWDEKEPCFEFESCGLRYLENRIDGLEDFILKFCNEKEQEILSDYY